MIAVIKNAGDFQKTLERAFAVAQAVNVRDLLIGFQREAKTFRNAFGPVQKRGLCGHTIKAVIDFDGRELLRIKGKHFAVWELLWIEIPLPLFVGVSGSSNKKFARARDGASPFVAFRPETFNHSHCISRRRSRPCLTIRRVLLLWCSKRRADGLPERNFVPAESGLRPLSPNPIFLFLAACAR